MAVEISLRYEGNLRCLSTHEPSGAELATDAPRDNLGQGESYSPTDLAATALASCLLTTMAIVAKKKGLAADLRGTTARVRKHMTVEPPRRIAELEIDVDFPLPEGHPDRNLLEETGRTCPVALSLHPDVKQVLVFHWQK